MTAHVDNITAGRRDVSPRKKTLIVLAHAFVGWLLCDLTMVVGMAVTSLDVALVAHLIGAPIYFTAVSWHYFTRYGFTTPLQTAATFISFVVLVDFLLVAMVIEGSFEMFTSPIGTWIPFLLIVTSTYVTGLAVRGRHEPAALGR